MELFKGPIMACYIDINYIKIMGKLVSTNIIRKRAIMLLKPLHSFVSLFKRSDTGWRLRSRAKSKSKNAMGQEQRKRIGIVSVNIAEVLGEYETNNK